LIAAVRRLDRISFDAHIRDFLTASKHQSIYEALALLIAAMQRRRPLL